MQPDVPTAPSSRLPWPLVPIAAYLAITLVLPALDGAATSPRFWHHAAWVLGGSAAVGGALWALGGVMRRTARLWRATIARRASNEEAP